MTSLDVRRLLELQSVLSITSELGNAPRWNFPLGLFGLFVVIRNEHAGAALSDTDLDLVKAFSYITSSSLVGDLFWLFTPSETSTGFFTLVFFVLIAAIKVLVVSSLSKTLQLRGVTVPSHPLVNTIASWTGLQRGGSGHTLGSGISPINHQAQYTPGHVAARGAQSQTNIFQAGGYQDFIDEEDALDAEPHVPHKASERDGI